MRIEFVIRRVHEPPRLPGQPRVIVALHDLVYGFNRVIAAHQLFSRNVEPLMVRALAEAERQALREKMLSLLDTVLLRPPVQPLREPRVIALSDILNALLNRARLSDGDLAARCPACGRGLSLSACKITAGHETTYACPGCWSPWRPIREIDGSQRAVVYSGPSPGSRRVREGSPVGANRFV